MQFHLRHSIKDGGDLVFIEETILPSLENLLQDDRECLFFGFKLEIVGDKSEPILDRHFVVLDHVFERAPDVCSHGNVSHVSQVID